MSDRKLPEGPHFVYDDAPGIFGSRRGLGPLDIAWDTNILVDYLIYGPMMWEGEPTNVPDENEAELEGLQLLIQLWQVREIRFRLFERSIEDARHILVERRRTDRARAVAEFASALTLSSYGSDDEDIEDALMSRPGAHPTWLPATVRAEALSKVPAGADRDLVGLALSSGMHVFLTRDKGVLRARDALRQHGLLLATPLELIEKLAACGALLCIMRRETTYWPIPDLQRFSHLIQALGG